MLTIGFINPFASADTMGEGLKDHNIKSVAIYERTQISNPQMEARYKPELFDEVIFIEPNESIEDIVNKLRHRKVDFVFNGFEFSTPLTDAIANQLHPEFANDASTSRHRYEKHPAQMQLAKSGIPVPKHIEINADELSPENEALLSDWQFPLILKPSNAGGTIGFHECANMADLKQKLKVKMNEFYGEPITSYLVQEKLIGVEFAVDTFSLQGKHEIITVREYHKEYFDDIPLSRMTNVVFPSDPRWTQLTEHMKKVLDALGFQNGLCHSELFITDRGIFAIDMNPRLPGANNSSCIMTKESSGYSHIDVLSHVLLKKEMPVKTPQHARVLYLQNTYLHKIDDVQVHKISPLSSFKRCIQNVKKGTEMGMPKQLRQTIAFVVLSHPDLAQIEQDTQTIFALEKNRELY